MITKENYFELNNKGLSQSKIKDYIIDPSYFYRKNITGILEKNKTKTFDIGSAVDDILTEMNNLNNYAVFESDRRTKGGKEEYQNLVDAGKTPLSRADYDKIVDLADAIIKTDAYTQIAKDYEFQEIIQVPADFGEHFDCLYGKPDAYRINEDGVCDLLDLKTTQSVNDKRYYYQFLSFRYDIQLWFYSFLLKQKYPAIKSFRYWHLAVEKKEPYLVKLFSIPNSYIGDVEHEVLTLIDKIKNDKEFKKYNPSFETPTQLGSFLGEEFGEYDDR